MRKDLRAALTLLAGGFLAACDPAALTGAGASLETQPGPRATVWRLTSIESEDGHVLATFRVSTADGRREAVWIPAEEASLIDDAAAMRYRLLIGSDGKLLGTSGDRDALRIQVERDTPVWMKFAAPPEGARTVSIALPRIGSFDGVPLQR